MDHFSLTEMKPMYGLIDGAFLGVACYNAFEMLLFVFHTFQRNSGLYFWSMLVATVGLFAHSVSVLLSLFGLPLIPLSAVIVGSWFPMVIGHSLMLYSRLHLVVADGSRKLFWVLTMIIALFFLLDIPSAAFFIDTCVHMDDAELLEPIMPILGVLAQVQVTVTAVQDTFIAGLYVYEASHTMAVMDPIKAPQLRSMRRNLVLLFILSVVFDGLIVFAAFTEIPMLNVALKPLAYSIKMKIEALVLTNLVSVIKRDPDTLELQVTEPQSQKRQHEETEKSPKLQQFVSVRSTSVTGRSIYLVPDPYRGLGSIPKSPISLKRDTMELMAGSEMSKLRRNREK